MKRLSIAEEKKIADLYQDILNEDMDVGGILGGAAFSDDLGEENADDYAPGDNRIPKLLGKVQTRKGVAKKTKKSKKGKGTTVPPFKVNK